MSPPTVLEVQGHRGARGCRPENTLAGFERAFDLGVSSVETDLHLSADGVPVVFHDPQITPSLCAIRPGHAPPDPESRPLVRTLSLAQLRGYCVERNPNVAVFPAQCPGPAPLAADFATRHGLDPLGIPTLGELFAFASSYAGEEGAHAGKTAAQRRRAAAVRFDLELKRVPFVPETVGDDFDGNAASLLERAVVEAIRAARMLARSAVRSFDHRCLRAIKDLEPTLPAAALIDHTAPVDPVALLDAARADVYAPLYLFLDADLVRRVHAAGKRVIPWTVNRPADWERLVAWGVDGLTTDFPGELLAWLDERGFAAL